jgi:transcription elongation factor GreA
MDHWFIDSMIQWFNFFMTVEVKQKLQAELDQLETELRVHLPKEIKRAREFGDLRENSEYQTALQRQTMVKARIRELRQRMSEVSSIDLSRIPRDKAGYGSTLVLYDAERDEEVTYRLVTPEESDPTAGLISTVSPIGRSLMGKEEGDEVVVSIPSGSRRFEIRRLTTLHDEASE